jgi:hypothetical protein
MEAGVKMDRELLDQLLERQELQEGMPEERELMLHLVQMEVLLSLTLEESEEVMEDFYKLEVAEVAAITMLQLQRHKGQIHQTEQLEAQFPLLLMEPKSLLKPRWKVVQVVELEAEALL